MPGCTAQFNVAVRDVAVGTSCPHTGEAMKQAVEAHSASLLLPTTMWDLLLNLRAPKVAGRTLS